MKRGLSQLRIQLFGPVVNVEGDAVFEGFAEGRSGFRCTRRVRWRASRGDVWHFAERRTLLNLTLAHLAQWRIAISAFIFESVFRSQHHGRLSIRRL